MKIRRSFAIRSAALTVLLCAASSLVRGDDQSAPRERTFDFTYSVKLKDLPDGGDVRVWLPVPTDRPEQEVDTLRVDTPGEARFAVDPDYGNKTLYVETRAGGGEPVDISVRYRVTRREVQGAQPADSTKSAGLSRRELQLALQPNRLVPIVGKPLDLLTGLELEESPADRARQLYELVEEHMSYNKEGTGWGRGDSNWACDSGRGNCTDFHSLFMSLARARELPCRFEIGFPLPPERGAGKVPGYHCWAFFHLDDRGWVPVDISEADKHPDLKEYYFGNLTEDRVTFSTGRDLTLVPPQSGPPLNFFVYPYVELDGEPLPADKLETAFSYADK